MAVAPQKHVLEQNYQLPTPPKVWISGFLSVGGNRKLVSAIIENGINGHSSPKMHPRAKLPITDPPKVWVSGFLSVDGNRKLVSAIMENGLPIKSVLEQRFSFYPMSHLFVVLHFLILHHCNLS